MSRLTSRSLAALFLAAFLPAPAAAALEFKKGSFTKATAVGSQPVTGVGFRPKAVVFFWTRQTAADTFNPEIQTGYGFATGPANERAVAITSEDGSFGGNTGKGQWQSSSIVLFNAPNPLVGAQAELTSLDGDGFTLNWTVNEARADIIHYIAFGGSDITNAKVDHFVKATGTGNLPITGVGFKPDFVMFLAVHTTGLDFGTTEAQLAVGFASGPTERVAFGSQLEDGDGFARGTCKWQRADRVLVEMSDTCAADSEFDFVSFDSDGFTVNRIVNNNDTRLVHYLALQGGTYQVGSFGKSTAFPAPVDQPVGGIGFPPVGLILASKNGPANPADETNARLSFGAADGTTEGAIWWHDQHAITADNAERTSTSKVAVHATQPGTLDAEADLKSFDAGGFTLTWTTVSTSADEILYVAVGNSTNYRSIGTAPDYTTGTVAATTGSKLVTGSGTSFRGANRGRGDRIQIDGVDYTVFSVDSETQLTLTSTFTGATGVAKPYTISRQYGTLVAWEDCIDGPPGAGCTYFPVASSSLVTDRRSEVGIIYDDGGSLAGGLVIDGSITDETHTVTLTVAQGNRHNGIPGAGVVIDNGVNTTPAIQVMDDHVTVEFLEIQNGSGGGAWGIDVFNVNPGLIVLRNNLIHDLPTWGIKLDDTDLVADVYNNIVYSTNIGIRVAQDLQAWSQIRLLNNTLYNNVTYGVNSSASINPQQLMLRNNIAATNGTDYALNGTANAASSHNLSTDPSAALATVSPGGFALANQNIDGDVQFVNRAVFDLHIQSTSAAANNAADLSGIFAFDVDGGARVAPWDIGADDILATTAVDLASFVALGRDGAVELRWETDSELNNLGFHLYRAEILDGPYERITARPIPGLGSTPVGASYRYTDSGLVNGRTYFYQLEDIETTGKTMRHGPVSATPSAGAALVRETPSLITYGRPEQNALRELSRDSAGVVLELTTEGFTAEPQEDGSARLEIPGFEDLEGSPSVPVLRPWIEVLSGRGVVIARVEELSVELVSGLTPSGAGEPELVANGRGTVRARRGRARGSAFTSALVPEDSARLLEVGFQGDSKKARLELAPLRWNGSNGELSLAKRLVIHLSFRGRVLQEHREKAGHRDRRVAARLVATQKGLHQISFEAIAPGGRRMREIPVDALRLSRQGEAIAFHIEPDAARFGPGSKLYFVSEGPEANPYGDELVYELELGGGGLRMGRGSAAPWGGSVPSYTKAETHEQNRFYQAGLVDATDLWLWDVLLAPAAKSYSFEAKDLAPGPSRLALWLQGASSFASDPDHHVRLYVNDVLGHELWWDGKETRRVEMTLESGALRQGENVLRIENTGDTEAPYSMVMLDRFEVVYPRTPAAENGRFEGSFSMSGTVSVAGLGSSHLLDVTDGAPRWLSGAEVSADASFRFRAEAGRSYLTVSRNAVHEALVRPIPATRLRKETLAAEYLIIGPQAFSAEAARLLDQRRSQGLKVKFAALEDVYSEFGFGEERPEAIRECLSYAYHHWRPPRLRYVLLLGDASYDFKDYLKTGVRNQLPPLITKTSYLWTASDPALAAVNGDDLLPDFAIGRLPAANLGELRAMVSKILAYETAEAGLGGLVVLAADNADQAGDYPRDAEEIARGVLAGKPVRRLYLHQLGSSMTGEILRAFDEGSSLVSYIGHGGIHLWADENVLNTSHAAELSLQPQQPLLVTMNCLNGYFHFPYFDSLAETLLKAEGRGAIAAFSPSGLSLNAPAHRLHQLLLDALFHQGRERLGDAVLAAQADYASTGDFPELLSIYHLLGDPALRLR